MDWQLWREACDRREASATRLVRLLTPQALGLALQMLGRREDAEDAVQDAFARLWRSAPSDTRGAKLATYFNTIVINRCKSLLVQRREQGMEPEALQARVMAQWRATHGAPAQLDGQRALRWSAAPRWWAVTAGLALCAVLAVALWLQRPDPVLEELMQPDVLSQMVAGEL